jgi:hypothetical protein
MIKRLRAGLTGAVEQPHGGFESVSAQREKAQILLDQSNRDPEELLKSSGKFLDMLHELGTSDDVATRRLVVRALANLLPQIVNIHQYEQMRGCLDGATVEEEPEASA